MLSCRSMLQSNTKAQSKTSASNFSSLSHHSFAADISLSQWLNTQCKSGDVCLKQPCRARYCPSLSPRCLQGSCITGIVTVSQPGTWLDHICTRNLPPIPHRHASIPAKNCNSARNGRKKTIPTYTMLVCSGPGCSLQVEKRYGEPWKSTGRFSTRVQTPLKQQVRELAG